MSVSWPDGSTLAFNNLIRYIVYYHFRITRLSCSPEITHLSGLKLTCWSELFIMISAPEKITIRSSNWSYSSNVCLSTSNITCILGRKIVLDRQISYMFIILVLLHFSLTFTFFCCFRFYISSSCSNTTTVLRYLTDKYVLSTFIM